MKYKGSKAQRLYKAGQRVRVCQNPNTDFHGFTMQKNHIFGQDEEGYFVVRRIMPVIKGKKKPWIEVYRLLDDYIGDRCVGQKWMIQHINPNTETGRQIMAANRTRPEKIEYISTKNQVKSFYNPPIKCGSDYTPMRNMRIPGGAWNDGTGLVTFKKPTPKLYKDTTKHRETTDYYTAMEWGKRGNTIEIWVDGKRTSVVPGWKKD